MWSGAPGVHRGPPQRVGHGLVSEAPGLSVEDARKSLGYHFYEVSLDEECVASLESTAEFLVDYGTILRTCEVLWTPCAWR